MGRRFTDQLLSINFFKDHRQNECKCFAFKEKYPYFNICFLNSVLKHES